eukprot:10064174-Alexandrium_andersonii.AAC.1
MAPGVRTRFPCELNARVSASLASFYSKGCETSSRWTPGMWSEATQAQRFERERERERDGGREGGREGCLLYTSPSPRD